MLHMRSVIGLSALLSSLGLVAALWLWRRRSRNSLPSSSSFKPDSIAPAGTKGEAAGNGRQPDTTRVRQRVEEEITIPGDIVGYIIGRRGNRVRQFEEESGARLRFKELQGTEDKVSCIIDYIYGCIVHVCKLCIKLCLVFAG